MSSKGLVILLCTFVLILATACAAPQATTVPPTFSPATQAPAETAAAIATQTQLSAPTAAASQIVPPPLVPNFTHIIVLFFENREFGSVIGNSDMPNYNRVASGNSLLTQYYAITHPSLPNYIAVFSGDTFKITSDCTDCFVNAASLPDQIEASGRTWRAYLEDMPHPCFVGDTLTYVQKHDPFIYFDPIRLDKARCQRSIVPLSYLETDMASGTLPNFVYIMPNECNSAHDAAINPSCGLSVADSWLGDMLAKLNVYVEPRAASEPSLIVLTWDEGQGNHSCCGLPAEAGGRVPTVLISPLAKSGFQDATPYTHYSLLKTMETAWNLSYLGHAAEDSNALIVAPWK